MPPWGIIGGREDVQKLTESLKGGTLGPSRWMRSVPLCLFDGAERAAEYGRGDWPRVGVVEMKEDATIQIALGP